MYDGRIEHGAIRSKVVSAADAAEMVRDGMVVATSGFTPAGHPKAVPLALSQRMREQSESLAITLITGASTGDELDGELSRANAIRMRAPYQTTDNLRAAINSGRIHFVDPHLGELESQMRSGYFGPVDVAIVEACAILDNDKIIPTTSVGVSPAAVDLAERVIVEVNLSQPMSLLGIHDIYTVMMPPGRVPIPICHPGDRIGADHIAVNPDKIAAVVLTDRPDSPRDLGSTSEEAIRVSGFLLEFFHHEIRHGRLGKTLLPLQSGVGAVANAVLGGLVEAPFEGLTFYSEVIQDSIIDLLECGKATMASGTAFSLSPRRLKEVLNNLTRYKDRMILRPQSVTNSSEVISRLGVIAMNTAVEFDIFGNVNSSHTSGGRLINGIGGSGDFARNAHLSIFCAPSVRKNNTISTVVPMVTHVDHIDNDVDIVVTEQGLADLRGLSPVKRARTVIRNCAHPLYRDLLSDYLNEGLRIGGHIPIALENAFGMHSRLLRTKDMRPRT